MTATQSEPVSKKIQIPQSLQNKPDQEKKEKADLFTQEFAERMRKARVAQKNWELVAFKQRAIYLKKMQRYIIDHAEEIVHEIRLHTNKTKIDAFTAEVFSCSLACDWYAKNAERILSPKRLKVSTPLFLNKRSLLTRVPVGVVGIISPWNYPFAIPFGEVIMGLMAGNAIILKVAPQTENVGRVIDKIMKHSELPQDLFQLVEGDSALIAKAMFDTGVNKIFFTGSVRVGKLLMEQASKNLTPLSLELGGNDPMLVLEDADLERATNGAAWGGYQNGGQTCGGVERVYVQEKVYDKFVEMLAKKTSALRHGYDENFNVDIGGITTQAQWETISSHVEEALQKGAKIIAQSKQTGRVDNGYYYPATLMVDVNHSMKIMKDETFGPILCVMKFKTIEEALALANDSYLALTSSVWSKDLDLAKSIARRLETGVTTINDHLYTHALSETPWGGWKESGLGRTHGQLGLEEMTNAKLINWDLLSTPRNLYWYPMDKATFHGIVSALHTVVPKSLGDFLSNGISLLGFVWKKMFHKWKV